MNIALIPILEVIKRTRQRRVNDLMVDDWFKQLYNINSNSNTIKTTRRLHIWIDEFTAGRFYLGPSLVAFEDETDFVIFKLWFK